MWINCIFGYGGLWLWWSLTVVDLYPVYTIKLARRAGYMLAGRASSLFAGRLLNVCSMSA